jgi:hypothetical protein
LVWLPPCWRASIKVLLMWPCKKNLASKLSYLLFPHPTHKTKTGTTNEWQTTNSNPPRPIKLSSQLQALGFAVSITSLSIRCKILGQNHFAILLS